MAVHLSQRPLTRVLLSPIQLTQSSLFVSRLIAPRLLPHTISISHRSRSISTLNPNPNRIPQIQSPSQDPLYPFTYTSGRWLHRDAWQRASRHISFDFSELCKKILALSPGSTHIVRYEKKEGNFNRVFVFFLNDGMRMVARLPTRRAGRQSLTTCSEVATVEYVRKHTSVPVPHILAWSADPTNPIGSEYIIMHHVAGVPLRKRWPSMSGSQYPKCVQAICMTMKQLAALEFPAYGSIYFENAPLGSEVKIPLSDGFCIGPHCSTAYWDCGVGESEMGKVACGSAGPWKGLAAYASGLIANGHSKLPSTSSPITSSRPSYFGTVNEHRNLLDSAQAILQTLIAQPQIANASAPTLLHADLHTRNIYVSDEDPTSITCLIDWQSSSIEPAFIYASDMPDFASAPEVSSEEENPSTEPPSSEQDKMQKVASYCNQTYEICMQYFIPKMRVARSLDVLLTRPFQYTHTSWRDSAAALRQEFLDLSSNWEDLGLAGKCPYVPTAEELERHQKEHRAFERAQELKQMLMKLLFVNSDGWVSIEDWEEVRRAHKAIFELALENAEEEGDDAMSEKNLRELWPFDDDGRFEQ